jgi:hypothetical protein
MTDAELSAALREAAQHLRTRRTRAKERIRAYVKLNPEMPLRQVAAVHGTTLATVQRALRDFR